jgi:tetratricopeptide (TPR) repeat protein
MRANVLNDPALVKLAGQFAWLSLDADQPVNAAFVDKFASDGVPLFLIIDPATGKPVLNWYGTATAPQLLKLLDDGKRAMAGGETGADALLARADEFNVAKKPEDAARLYEQALKTGGASWPHRTRAIESLVMVQGISGHNEPCIATAAREAPGMARDRSFVNTVYFGLVCAKPGTPELRQMEKLAEEGVRIPGILGDDTSSLYQQLAETYRRDKDEEDATRVATAWLQYLQVVSVAVFLHKPELALAEVQRAERELPGDYNPPRLLATIYRQMHRYDDAVEACDRAIAKAYGAPKARLYSTKGHILEEKGDKRAAKQAYGGMESRLPARCPRRSRGR